jgi:hypothetical protein
VFCRGFRSGSDGTRTRDLRRDRPAFPWPFRSPVRGGVARRRAPLGSSSVHLFRSPMTAGGTEGRSSQPPQSFASLAPIFPVASPDLATSVVSAGYDGCRESHDHALLGESGGERFEPSRDQTAPSDFRDLFYFAQPCALRPGARHNARQLTPPRRSSSSPGRSRCTNRSGGRPNGSGSLGRELRANLALLGVCFCVARRRRGG